MKLIGIFDRIRNDTERNRDLKTVIGMIKVYKNWYEILLDALGIFYKPERMIVLRNGIKYLAKDHGTVKKISSGKTVGNEIWVRNSYNPHGFEIKKGDIVVDIGAHIGTFSLYAAYYGAMVYSYEPSPLAFKLLKKNIKLNGFEKKIIPFHLAVWSRKDRRTIYISDNEPQGEANMFLSDEHPISIPVQCVTLKNIIRSVGHIDFLKCDCEGSEYEIFFDTAQKYLEKIEKISLEYHQTEKYGKEDLKNFFERRGFNVIIKPEFKNFGMMYIKR